jgi:hypothetical protein
MGVFLVPSGVPDISRFGDGEHSISNPRVRNPALRGGSRLHQPIDVGEVPEAEVHQPGYRCISLEAVRRPNPASRPSFALLARALEGCWRAGSRQLMGGDPDLMTAELLEQRSERVELGAKCSPVARF